ncbi:signal peptidase II [Pullulanibacillus pueri]|uniref:Lipoprotein signal peptidase n=1 Tax=Pullulanibacillus pueri TaxID=1437324 RepID=A0A8J2ZQC5_9BACL|nr:signal peptidase II [Pullulanibacillus pueri]MBM7679889.1 signal peptidase II [Pullulanibacillus pueri]GGH73335.1 lipoprotein signal peptidase [Pullulanibacillus pueri]
MLFYAIAILVIVMDQVSKYLIRTYIDINESFTLWGIQLTHIENRGMAGSLFQGYARIFGVVAILFVIGVLYFRRTRETKGALIDSSLGFLVGGAIGNGVDRLLFGQVTDFIVRSGGILNLADHAIEMGGLLLIIYGIVTWLSKRNQSL